MREFVKADILKVDNVVLYKIVEQDDTVIKRGDFDVDIDGVRVMSIKYPVISTTYGVLTGLGLRGGKSEMDKLPDIRVCEDDGQAERLGKKIRETINNLNKKLNEKDEVENEALSSFNIKSF